MKIRSRLFTAFFIMTIFPIVLMFICVHIILGKQAEFVTDSYNISESLYNNYDVLVNPVAYLYNISQKDYKALNRIANKNPDTFLNKDFLKDFNGKLLERDSFLFIVKNSSYYYIGDKSGFDDLVDIPLLGNYNDKSKHLTYIDLQSTSIIKGRAFLFTDNSLGQVFLVTDFSHLLPRWKHSILEIATAFFAILLTTGIILSIWIYKSILHPLNILRLAATQIGAGNLDQPIHITSSDEIGQLCRDFEDMRIRLKDLLEERIESEENTREIMSSISHDLKTPVTAIKGYTEGILDGVADTPEKQQKYLQTIYTKANDITYLIDELSLFSKVERNSLAYNFVSVNLENYFTDCIEDVSLDMESQNMTIDYYNTTDNDTYILADAEQLKRVLHNIIENAVKYNDKPEGGHISIRVEDTVAPKIPPPLYRQLKEDGTDLVPPQIPDEFIQVQIEDNGPGIAANNLPHIFDRFFRADTSRNSSKRGSGLGLAIVKRIISDHGGKVWAESIEGVGSSFYFTVKKDISRS